MKFDRMDHTIFWTWDSRMLWDVIGLHRVIIDREAYIRNYKKLIDFMSENNIKAVIIWGFLRSTHGGINAASEITDYASKKGVRIIPGVGIKSYGGFAYETAKYRIDDEIRKLSLDQLLLDYPELRARDENGSMKYWSHLTADLYPESHTDACPSKIHPLLDWYLEGIKWMYDTLDIGGLCFETGDNGLLCQCGECTGRRKDIQRHSNLKYVSYEDDEIWLPQLTEKALEMRADSWIIYTHYRMYNKDLCDNPPKKLMSLLPENVINMWTVQHDGSNPSKVLDDCDQSEAYRLRLEAPKPSTRYNVTNWNLGGIWMLWGLDGYPQYRQIAKAVKAGREMGHSGICIYGEIGQAVNFKGRYQFNQVNYLAMTEFCHEPDLTVDEFEERHKNLIKPAKE